MVDHPAPTLGDDIAVGLNLLHYLPAITKMVKAIQGSQDIQDGFAAISAGVVDYQKMMGIDATTVVKQSPAQVRQTLKAIQQHLDGTSPEGSGNFT